ncbi:MAG TPA: methyltransferase domain-containing protein [Streptosporangiaceae bacterium]|nr:methyltransferase domain-containing protein [Streptosporangiaceae bacterium]
MARTNDAQLLVLSALADGPLHGYAINAAIESVTGQRLGPGSLYGALARLERQALVEPVPGQGRQQPVRLTPAGRALLQQEAHSMARVSEHVFEAAVPDQVRYLDRLAATDAARSYKAVMLGLLGARPGQAIADLGCGPGTDLAALAAAVAPAGTVIGIDASPDMAARARERTAELAPVRVQVADLQDLPLAAGSVDGARADRVLQHVQSPARVLAEARRVLRPGGRLVLGEPDWDSLAIDYPDVALARAYTRHVADRIVRNGVIGRQLARLATQAGLSVLDVVPVTSAIRDVRSADQILGLQRNTERAVAAGYLTAGAAREWLRRLAAEPFFAAVTLYVALAEVPPA